MKKFKIFSFFQFFGTLHIKILLYFWAKNNFLYTQRATHPFDPSKMPFRGIFYKMSLNPPLLGHCHKSFDRFLFSREATLGLALSICSSLRLFIHSEYQFKTFQLYHHSTFSSINFLTNQLYSSLAQLIATFQTFCLVLL